MKILGIDPGSKKLGWAVLDMSANGGKPELMAHGLFKLRDKDSIEVRCGLIHEEIRRVIMLHLSSPLACYIAIEEPLVGTHLNYRSALTLATARGAALAACRDYNTKSYNVSTWKGMTVGGPGAPKQAVQEYVQRYFDLPEPLTEDESDAVAIAVVRSMEVFYERNT